MPARSGDCTSVRNRVSTSWDSIVRAVAEALARLALKIRSSINHLCYRQTEGVALQEPAAPGTGRPKGKAKLQNCAVLGVPVVLGLVALDQVLHPHGVGLAV